MTVDKRIELKGIWTPLYSKCPCCGFDLNKASDALIQQIKSDETKQGAGKAKFPVKACSKVLAIPDFLNNCVARVVLPFTKTKKNATKRNK
jgi:hypothetical protein